MNHVHQIVIAESSGFLDADSLPAAFTHLRKLDIPAASSPAERKAQSYAFLDWALRSALPWMLIAKGEHFRQVATAIMGLPVLDVGDPPYEAEDLVELAVETLHGLTNWKKVAKLRSVDDMLGCAGDCIAAIDETGRLLFEQDAEEIDESAIHEEMDRAVAFAAQMLVAGGDRKPFDAATVFLGAWAGIVPPEHGERMVKRVVRVDLSVRLPITRWCARCRMTIAVDARSAGCPNCSTAWTDAPTPLPVGPASGAPDQDLCPVAMGG